MIAAGLILLAVVWTIFSVLIAVLIPWRALDRDERLGAIVLVIAGPAGIIWVTVEDIIHPSRRFP